MPDPLPWREVLRRRNGLPATTMQTPSAEQLLANLTAQYGEQPPNVVVTFTVDASSAVLGLRRLADAAEPRCEHTDLPTAMCHHCKEIAMSNRALAQAAYDAYMAARDRRAFNGDPLPDWDRVPVEIQAAWLAAVVAIAAPADQAVRGVQQWMALDIHTALGNPVDSRPYVHNQGHASWGDWWAALVAQTGGALTEHRRLADLVASLDGLHTDAKRQLALLHEGEQPPPEDGNEQLSPAQMIWSWNRATPAGRLKTAAYIRDVSDRSDRMETALRTIAERCPGHSDSVECTSAIARAALTGSAQQPRADDHVPELDDCRYCGHLRGSHQGGHDCEAEPEDEGRCDCTSFHETTRG